MKLVHVALLYLGSVTFFGVDAARVDVATEFKRKWTKWALSRAKRDVKPSGALRELGAAADVQLLIRTQDVKEDPRVSHPSSREDAHIRVKRYRQSINNFPHFQTIRTGCRFGTCTVQKLAHQIYQLTDKDKDDAAPASKISPQGYGRRRRSLPERRSPPRSPQAGRLVKDVENVSAVLHGTTSNHRPEKREKKLINAPTAPSIGICARQENEPPKN
nr:ADM [Columba livia]